MKRESALIYKKGLSISQHQDLEPIKFNKDYFNEFLYKGNDYLCIFKEKTKKKSLLTSRLIESQNKKNTLQLYLYKVLQI